VVHTPGHTPGGVTFLLGEEAFTGDLVFAGSVGRTDLPGGSTETLVASIRERILVLPDETVLHPGHGPSTTVGRERRTNPFLQGGGGMLL
jgi:glyoxylase-like metal-dependent hydrolase (beta-lactamase superfamily II)